MFSKTIPISAARIFDVKKTSHYRSNLTQTKELLILDRLGNIKPDPDPLRASKGGKCFFLGPHVKPDGILAVDFVTG
jgi:hypothetical protein